MVSAARSEQFFELPEERDGSEKKYGNETSFVRARIELERRLRFAREDLNRIEQSREQGLTYREATLRVEEAELRIALFNAEHDNAGAFKFKRFARETHELFELDAPETALPEAIANRRYLFIHMGELDRLNKEGGHAAGDAGLTATVEAIEKTVRSVLPKRAFTGHYSIFRYNGNEYCVQFDNVPDADVTVIQETLQAATLELPNFKKLGAPPLTATRLDFSEAMDIFNSATLELPPEERISEGEYVAREVIGILRRSADFNLEVEKYVGRAYRVVEKLDSVRAGTMRRTEVQDFFDNYLKKMFAGSGIESIEQIETLWTSGAEVFERTVNEYAIAAARSRLSSDREFMKYERFIIRGRCKEWKCDESVRAEYTPTAYDAAQPFTKLAAPTETEGTKTLAAAKKNMDAAVQTPEYRTARLKYLIEASRRDSLTGLLERGTFYETLTEHMEAGEPESVLFIDMGFLKYFDQRGGREVGNNALKLAASVIERALNGSGARGEVYRYGGDEFTVRLAGGGAERTAFIQKLESIRASVGAVPGASGSAEEYLPEELVFNVGSADTDMVTECINDLRAAGTLEEVLAKRDWTEPQLRADLMVKIADAGVNAGKATDRFHLLIAKMQDPEYARTESTRHKQIESLIQFSQKAIFSELGGDAALRFYAEGAAEEDPAVLARQIEKFVTDRSERMGELTEHKQELIDTLIELHAIIRRLRTELAKTEHKTEQIATLQMRLTEAERTRAELIAARGTIDKMRKKE